MTMRASHALKGVLILMAMAAALMLGTVATADRRGGPDLRPQEPKTDVSKAPAAALPQGAKVEEQQGFDAVPPGWTVVAANSLPDQQPSWAIEGGVLAQDMTTGIGADFNPVMYLGPRNMQGDGIISAQVYPQGNQVVGLVFRATDAGHYVFAMHRDGEDAPLVAQLLRYDAASGAITKLGETTEGVGFALGRWQELQVELRGATITASFDGQQIFSVQDATFTSGKAGIYTLALGEVLFDNFTIAKR